MRWTIKYINGIEEDTTDRDILDMGRFRDILEEGLFVLIGDATMAIVNRTIEMEGRDSVCI